MADKNRREPEDDGRTIADMSGFERPGMIFPRRRARTPERPARPERDNPWAESGLSKEERRWYILGAIKASLLIALCFIVGLGLIVLLMVLFWS